MTRQEAVRELFFWYNGRADGKPRDNFHARLFDLIAKADPHNRMRLAAGFPQEVLAFMDWSEAATSGDFFLREGLSHLDDSGSKEKAAP